MDVTEAIKAARDPQRLAILRELNLLDTEAEEAFDRLTRLASKITNSPVSLVSLVDADRQFFKSLFGLPEDVAKARETPLSHSFCKHVVEDQAPLIVGDARTHTVLKDNSAIPDLNVVSYLGMPLVTSEGICLGSFCVIDTVPRVWSEREIEIVRELALSVMTEIELRAQISSRKELVSELRANQARTQLIIDTALDGVVVIDSQSRIMEWNSHAAQIFGWSRSEAVGRALHELIIPPAYREAHKAGVKRHQRTGEGPILGQRIEISALNRDGHEFPVELTVSPFLEGDKTLYSAFVRDITEQKNRESELEEAKELAEQASLTKGTFLANMSHEIRTPLNSIIGLTSLMLNLDMAADHLKHVQVVNRSGRTLLEIINNILDYSKLEAGKMQMEQLPFSLAHLLSDTRDLLINDARRKKIELSYHITPDTPVHIVGDATRLRQILINLTSNGINFTSQGKVSIRLDSTEKKDGKLEFHFQVQDSGIGIAPAHQTQLFQSFTQVDASTTREYGGTGLGLAICRELVEIMGGHIWVESELGRGSTFHFTLVMDLAAVATPPRTHLGAIIDAEFGKKHPMRILVAEDDAINQLVVLSMLERLGYQADVVDDGLEALRALRRQSYDLVLMDAQMPRLDGIATMQVIHDEWSEAERPIIIALTANALPGDQERFLSLGMDDYLPKPLLMETLVLALSRVVNVIDEEAVLSLETGGETSPQEPVEAVDVAEFEDRLGEGNMTLLYQLVALFLGEAERGIAAFSQGLADNDQEAMHQSIHKLKGSSSSAAAVTFAAICQEILELLAKGVEAAEIATYLPGLNQALAGVQRWQQQHDPDRLHSKM